MSNKVDKLFKEKLKEHSIQPSAQAWEKLEANLSKKNKSIVWFRLAAVLALVGLLTFAIIQWRNSNEETPQQLVETKKSSEQQSKESTPPIHLEEKKEIVRKEKLIEQKPSLSNPKKIENKAEENLEILGEKSSPELITEIEQKSVDLPSREVVTEKAVAASKPIKLVYSLPSLESKSVPQQEDMNVATAVEAEEKESPLKKAFNEIRSGDVLGDLRDAKDNLFALEFKKDKSKKRQ